MGQIKPFHILYTNDLHSHLDQTPKIYSIVHRLRKEWARQGEQSLLVDIGDHMDRSCMETEGTDGKVNGAILEETGYDIVTLGNNELLTFSKEELRLAYKDHSYCIISSNIFEQEEGKQPSWLKPWKIFSLDGIRVGFIAATVYYEKVYELLGWDVQDPMIRLKQVVQEIKPSVDIVVLLSHLGINRDREIAQMISGIDLIIGSHTHHLLEQAEQIGSTWIVAAGKYGEYIGKVLIEWDEDQKVVQQITGYPVSISEENQASEIVQLLQKYRKQAEETLSKPVAELSHSIHMDWKKESPLGNLLADSLRNWVGAEIALVNSGQLLNHLPKGTVTKGQVHAICPHLINPVLLQITGKEIRITLEESLMNHFQEMPIHGYGFRGEVLGSMCISGMKVTVDLTQQPYEQIRTIELKDRLLKDEDVIEIATIDMFVFGAGYLELKKGNLIKYYLPEFLRDLIIAQLQHPLALQECFDNRWIIR
ncbi:bifunctional metallophosphatase/5'-nucleotidase [Thermoflavimicrobium daqui]|nr:bifunctional UDP-sugar hydrolase/5'-nucleotidase [Thermoflavimicrobium daqui]